MSREGEKEDGRREELEEGDKEDVLEPPRIKVVYQREKKE